MRWKLDGFAVMDIIQLTKYKFFRRFGVFSVDKTNAREAIKSIEFAARLLCKNNRALWIFPQGEMHPANYRPIRFYNGISKIIKRAGLLNAVPVTLHYEFINEQRPEIFISIGNPIEFNNEKSRETEITANLQNILCEDLELQRSLISRREISHYKTIVSGKKSISASLYSSDRIKRID